MAKKILIVGYGTAGRSLARSLKRNNQPIAGYLDDVAMNGEVLGTLAEVNRIIKKHKITDIYFAIPSSPAKVVRDFLLGVEDEKVKISIIPRSFKILSKNTVNVHDLTDVDILQLVGRQPVKHDLLETRKFIKGKKIVVTGAAGSIGSKVVSLLASMEPESVVCVDWWENGIFYLQHEMGHKKNFIYKIADIKNPYVINKIFTEYKPDIVFHAAAYKHVPLMQDNPIEAFNNNVWGSLNLMRQAVSHGVKNFVYVSTDKAVNPVNVMGATKRLGEMLMEVLAGRGGVTKFNAVRFGNVIQSNGSVVNIFKKQIDQGRSLTVTDKDVTRFFMTVEEAAQLIVHSTVLGKNGEIFVLDMGEQVKIMDLAKSLVKLLNKPIKIETIGLRPGEKMFEELIYDPNKVEKTPNNKVFVVKGEKPFRHKEFIDAIDRLIDKSLKYELAPEDFIVKLRTIGFRIKE